MATNLFEQLAQSEIPPPPPEFDRQLHERVNRTLIVTQLIDLALSAMPWAMLQLGRALLGIVTFSLTGHYGSKRDDDSGDL
jgi:hypothetical protein